MHVIKATNVNDALPLGIMLLKHAGVLEESRGGPVIAMPEPVATSYARPMQCVLFDQKRDANPFFHLLESMWILAGRRDVQFPAQVLPRIADYSDTGRLFHGAYGHRLRNTFGFDQLDAAIRMLRADPTTRRCVVSIYHPMHDLEAESKDIPCNDMIMFRALNGALNMTVCNRSNDAIWGCYGANAVQFGTLLGYMAMRTGLAVGTYTQVSNNLHAYIHNEYWRSQVDVRGIEIDDRYLDTDAIPADRTYAAQMAQAQGIDADLRTFFHLYDEGDKGVRYDPPAPTPAFQTALVRETVMPLWRAHQAYRKGDILMARAHVEAVGALDWRIACTEWLARRQAKRGAYHAD